MARIRTIKPDFWTDEKLSECSLSARLTFIGLFNFCDDEGRMEYQPARIRMQLYPCGSVTHGALIKMLGELTERSLIRVYVVDGKEYLDVPNFTKHQKINRPTPSRLPPYSGKSHGVLSEGSGTEGKGREGKGKELQRAAQQPGVSPDGFAAVREAYPKRAGSQRWGDAERNYGRRLAEGHTPETILAGVKRYAAHCASEAIVGQRTVQQAATFLGENRCFLEPYAPAPRPLNGSKPGAPPRDLEAEQLAAARSLGFTRRPEESTAEYLKRFNEFNQRRIAGLEGRAA